MTCPTLCWADVSRRRTSCPSALLLCYGVSCAFGILLIGWSRGKASLIASPVLPNLQKLVQKCLDNSNSYYGKIEIPRTTELERQQEFSRMLAITEITRGFGWHSYCGYHGPWIEDLWIEVMCCDRKISDFGVCVPIFVPWTDWRVALSSNGGKWRRMIKPIFRTMRNRFFYVTVVQGEQGLEAGDDPYTEIPPNLLLVSPGGKGHIPIILSTKGQVFIERTGRNNSVLFAGSVRDRRKVVLDHWKGLLGSKLTITQTKEWMDLYRNHDFILSPRGNGRGCFRTGEALEMGLVIVMAFRSRLWVPYLNSTLPWDKIGFYSVMNDAESVVSKILSMTESDILAMRAMCRGYKHTHFTMNASVAQIGHFLKDGFSRSDLRCDRYYLDV